MSLVHPEQSILAEVDAATDEASTEAGGVSALGKKGPISERMPGVGGGCRQGSRAEGQRVGGLVVQHVQGRSGVLARLGAHGAQGLHALG